MSFLKSHHENGSPALQRCKSFTFDVNQQAESLVQWEQRYNQHSGGIFNGYLDELTLGGIHFFEEFTNRTLQQQCSMKQDKLWLGFSLQAQRPKINNSEVLAGQIMTRPSDVEFELITPEDFHIYGLVLDKKTFSDELVGADLERWYNQAAQASATNHVVSYELAKLISLLLNNSNTALTKNDQSGDENITRLHRLMPLISSKVADLLSQVEYEMQDPVITRQSKLRVIAEINNYIKQTGVYPLTTTELCKIANVSRRALQYCFEQGLGMSPIQYIRDCRLNEIRRTLLAQDNDIGVADLALNLGFFHLGTFNSQYKQLFGETPTQTMQRAPSYQHITSSSV